MSKPEYVRQALMYLREHVIVYLYVGLNSCEIYS